MTGIKKQIIYLFIMSERRKMSDKKDNSMNDQFIERKRPDYIQNLITGSHQWSKVLQNPPYAGDSEKPRPLPKTTFLDFKEKIQGIFRISLSSDVLIYAFHSDKYKFNEQESIPIPKKDFIFLAREADFVLLSDRVTQHYTKIYKVDRKLSKIFLLDPWPNKIFLREGYNEAGISAEIVDNIVSITMDEFLRIIVGIITFDTPELIEHYFHINSSAKKNAHRVLSLGCSLLNYGNDKFVDRSLPYLRLALNLSEQTDNTDLKLKIAQRLIVALNIIYYINLLNNNDAENIKNEIQDIYNKYSKIDIDKYSIAEDYYRLGNASGRAGQYIDAINFYSEVISIDNNHEDAYLYRALAKSNIQDTNGAINDATKAVGLLERKYNKAKLSLNEPVNESSKLRQLEIFNTLDQFKYKITEVLNIRGNAYYLTGQKDLAYKDAKTIQHIQNELNATQQYKNT